MGVTASLRVLLCCLFNREYVSGEEGGGDGTSDKRLQNGLRGDMTMPGIVGDGLKRDVM